jgi:hypothetical protein
MFKEIRVGNFKGFNGIHTLELSKINLFYGANSAGKSALLEALLLLKQSIRRNTVTQDQEVEPFVFNGSDVDLGSFQAAINGHDVGKKLILGGSYDRGGPGVNDEGNSDVQHFDVEVAWNQESRSQILESVTYRVDNAPENSIIFRRVIEKIGEMAIRPIDELGFDNVAKVVVDSASRKLPTANEINLSEVKEMMQSASYENWSFLPGMPSSESATHAHLENLKVMQEKLEQEKKNQKVRIEGQEDMLESLQKALAVAQEEFRGIYLNQTLRSTWRDLLLHRYRDTGNSLSRIRYLGPLRKFPTRIERLVEKSKKYVGREGEGVASILHRDPSIVAKVNEYMLIMQIPYELHVIKLDADGAGILGDIIALQLVDLRSNVVLSLEDVGFGISQVLPILVQLAISKSDMVLIEQPELHLHPAVQAHFGDLLIDGITPDSKNQFIIETHSEHLLLRLQRRIREGILSSEDIRIYYIDANKELGSYVQLIEMDDQGEFITAWPNGFFPERLDEMLA